MLYRLVYGVVLRISPDALVPVLRSGETKSAFGGAGNVVRNLLALGSCVSFVSTVGNDSEALEIRDMLSNFDGDESNLIAEQQRKTTVKTRFMAGRQKVLRVDRETTGCLEKRSRETGLQAIREFIDSCYVDMYY